MSKADELVAWIIEEGAKYGDISFRVVVTEWAKLAADEKAAGEEP